MSMPCSPPAIPSLPPPGQKVEGSQIPAVREFLDRLDPLLPPGWTGRLELFDPRSKQRVTVGVTGSVSSRKPATSVAADAEEVRILVLVGERHFGRLLLAAHPDSRGLGEESWQRVRSLCRDSTEPLERVQRDKLAAVYPSPGGAEPVRVDGVDYHFGLLVGDPRGPMGHVYRALERVAPVEGETVLLVGETGTGKELVARALHAVSSRASRPLVATNFGALGGDPNLIHSELFGHERGAFTGATHRRRGAFEQAHRSTLLIDELEDIVPSVQVKLLRVLGPILFT